MIIKEKRSISVPRRLGATLSVSQVLPKLDSSRNDSPFNRTEMHKSTDLMLSIAKQKQDLAQKALLSHQNALQRLADL